MMPGSGDDVLRTTGGQIDSIVLALIEASYDKNEQVTSSICKSLFAIGKHQPNLALSSCHSYLKCHPKLPLVHKIVILTVMEQVCNDALKSIGKDVAQEIIKLAVEEMIASKEIVPEWQNVTSGILVSLGRNHHHEVMRHLIGRFQPGVLPHFFILQTMANLATANVFGMVPFLKAVLGTLLPLLCTVKQENMKWIFAYALSHFSEAIIEYLANIEKAPDPTVTRTCFDGEIASAYDVLFSSWLQSREAKVRSEVVVALGQMTYLLSPEKIDETLPKVIPAVLSMYKRHQEYQYTTQGLCMVLDAAVTNKCNLLEAHIDSIFIALFPQVCTFPDYTLPASVRNHNEVLRCFAVLTTAYADRILTSLLFRLESNNEGYRIGALTVLKHLINSSNDLLKSKVPKIVYGLKAVFESGNKVKKVVAQVIVALAHHGYLENEGGLDMVKFIVSQCALADDAQQKKPIDPHYVSNEALRGMCENVMQLLTTTVDDMENILWPNLFDFLLCDSFTTAISPICRSLALLSAKKREELGTDFDIHFSCLTNVTTPQALFARLVVLTGCPHEGRNCGIHVLHLLKNIAPAISRNLRALWDTKIPLLIQILESVDVCDWNQQIWEDQVTEFFSLTLGEYDREEWSIKLGKELISQFPLHENYPQSKYILLKFLGVIMKKVTNKTFINQALDAVFDSVNHHSALERLGCAIAAGYCSATHLDLVLVKLEQTAKDDRKSSGLFSFIKDFKTDPDYEKLKATIILCYGHVTLHGPAPILSTRIETPILRSVSNFYVSSRDLLVKETMLETIKLIAEAVHPSKMNDGFVFRSRNELLSLTKNILKNELTGSLTCSVRSLALNASASLVTLDPALKEEEKQSLLDVAVSSVYCLPREVSALKSKDDGTADLSVNFDKFLFSAMDALNLLLENMLLKEKNHRNLQTILQILYKWMNSKHDVERERCMNSILHMFHAYANAIKSEGFSPFACLGYVLGILVPRCTDPQVTVRHLAFDSIEAVLSIALRASAPYEAPTEYQFNYLKQQIISDDPSSLFTVTKDLGKIISEKLPVEQTSSFLKSLIFGLCDPHSLSSSGASVILNIVIKMRGREISHEVGAILEIIRSQLTSIQCPHTRKGALHSIQNLALYHSIMVLSAMLNSNLPLDVHSIDIWKTLAREENLSILITDHCIEILSESVISSPPDPHGRTSSPVAVFKPLSAVCAFREVFRVAEMQNVCKEKFSEIFSVLILVCGQYVGALPPCITEDNRSPIVISKRTDIKVVPVSPVRCAVEALKNFLICAQQDAVVICLAEAGDWILLEDLEKYPEAVSALGRSLCLYCPEYIPKIIAYLNSMLNSPLDVQRVVTVALFVEFLSQTYKGQKVLIDPLINNLLGRLVDPSRVVRRLCIHGLGCVGRLEKDQGQRYSTTVLSAMMAGMDDQDDPGCDITLEAMNGLSSILSNISEENVRGTLINITLRIKQMFEKDKPAVRVAAFTLFGNLSCFGNGPSKEPFVEQVHSNLVSLLLHLNDRDKQVIKACKHTLRLLGPFLDSKDLNDMFQKHLLEDAHLHYGEFINGLTKIVIIDFQEKIVFYATTCVSYLKSQFSYMQCNAAAFLGYLLGNLPVDLHHLISKEKICSALVSLLKDQCPEVRIRAAESLSLLYEY